MLFICPKCKSSLEEDEGRAVCKMGHSYDKSKYGYYNLLLSNVGGVHGDNKLMVEARRGFLEGGFYSPLAEKLTELTLKYTKNKCTVLDAGCGEGYYTNTVYRALVERDEDAKLIAFDISKEAVRYTKKRVPDVEACVASCYSMPISDGAADTVINVFSPLAPEETHRVLKAGGIFIVAVPDTEHLFGLKSVLYEIPYKNTVNEIAPEGFSEVERVRVRYTMTLDDPRDIQNLFMMTPYAYRTGESGRERLKKAKELVTEADFSLFIYKRL